MFSKCRLEDRLSQKSSIYPPASNQAQDLLSDDKKKFETFLKFVDEYGSNIIIHTIQNAFEKYQ